MARTVAMKGIAIPDLRLNDLASPLSIMKPESQKIGRPVINPVIPIAAGLLFSPVIDKIQFAMLNVAPVRSRVIPIIAPNIIRNPIDAIVPPKPSLSVLTTLSAGRVVNARNTETRNRAIKALSLIFDVRMIIARILIATRTDIIVMLIRLPMKRKDKRQE